MATADWKQPYNEPENYGWYVGSDDCGWCQVKITAWDHLPPL